MEELTQACIKSSTCLQVRRRGDGGSRVQVGLVADVQRLAQPSIAQHQRLAHVAHAQLTEAALHEGPGRDY